MGIELLVRGSASNKTPSHRPLSEWEGAIDGHSSSSRQSSAKPEEAGRVSFLKVPNSPIRRPSTADVVIEKLKVERVEGGGLSISGVALAANCHFTLLIFGTLFLLAGLVLSYVGFASKKHKLEAVAQAAGAPNGTFQKSDTHKQMQVIGPIFLVLGFLMVLFGLSMYALSKKVRHNDKARRATISAMQLSQLENTFSRAHIIGASSPLHTTAPAINDAHPILSLRRGSLWMEPTPIEAPKIPIDSVPYPLNSRSPSPHSDNFPVSFDPTGDTGGRRFSSSFTRPPQIFEVQECSPSGSFSNEPISGLESLSGDQNQSSDSLPSEDASEERRNLRTNFQIPQIQVTPSSIEALSGMSGTLASVTSSLPLSRNGVALPRLSRHSVSTRGET